MDLNSNSITAARSRWKLLAKVLQEPNKNGLRQDHSQCLPLFTTTTNYGLFKCNPLSSKESFKDVCGYWIHYSCDISPDYSLNIRHLSKPISVNKLAGFNNTGNLGVWPSEEVLAYYCLKRWDMFKDKSILELGGGMTCLSALTVATSSKPSSVCCTDGNPISVSNIQKILQHNSFKNCPVSVQRLDWKDETTWADMANKWDIILCADWG